jgi:hypothetical protein
MLSGGFDDKKIVKYENRREKREKNNEWRCEVM